MNRFFSFLCVIILAISLTACSKQPEAVIVPTETEVETPSNSDNSGTAALIQGSLSESEIDSIIIGDDDSSYVVIPSKSLVGQYLDSYSQRAVADITENNSGTYHITINWGNSAFETVEWDMDATLEDDKLVYNNCVNRQVSIDENNESETVVLYSDGTGYFEIVDDNLHWTGAADDNCKECVFCAIASTD